jgi:hypothetical protein
MNEHKDNTKTHNTSKNTDSDSDSDENYVIKTKVCKRLSKEFGLEEINCDGTIMSDPPTKHGLSNSFCIIPSYYHLHNQPLKILDVDFFEIIKDDIRNCRTLNKYQMEYIKEIKDEYKYELIELFNECLNIYKNMFEEA